MTSFNCRMCETCTALCALNKWGLTGTAFGAMNMDLDYDSIDVHIGFCRQCAAPSCAAVCPKDAIQYNESLCTCDYIAPMVAGSDQVSLITFPIPKSDEVMDKLCDPEFSTHPEWTAEQFEAATGIPTSLEDLYVMAWRSLCVERAVQVRDSDRNRDNNDKPNAIFLNRKDRSGISVSEADLEEGLAMIYELLGWDPETGRPTRDGLEMWGLGDIADGLEACGRLSEAKINTNLRAELIAEGERETAKNAAYYKAAFEGRDKSRRFERIRQDATSGYRKNN